jgi:hypothetical protein
MTVTGTITATHLTYLTVSNGDFELGDLTGWSTGGDAWDETNIVAASDGDPYEGTYSAWFWNTSTTDPVYITQNIDLTSVSSILFYRKWHVDGNNVGVMTVSIGDTNVATYAETESGAESYAQKTIDVSSFTDTSTLKFALTTSTTTSPDVCNYYLDYITLYPTDVVTVATIEDTYKSLSANQYNGYTFIITSGASLGQSCLISDTFANYIQVPTTFTAINHVNSEVTETTYNGDFETGDLSEWTIECTATGTAVVGATYKDLGDYGCQLYATIDTGVVNWATISQRVDLTGDYFCIAYKVNDGPLDAGVEIPSFGVSVDGEEFLSVGTRPIYPSDWNLEWYYLPTYSITGTASSLVKFYAYSGDRWFDIWIDAFCVATIVSGDTYEIIATATSWDPATALTDPGDYLKACNTYATVLGSIDYGDGSLVLDFATNIGVDTGLTWVIDTDVYRADVNTDYSRIGTLMRGKGTKLCTGTIHSYIPDNTYELKVATIGDTFLLESATAGAAAFYVYDNTRFGTSYGYGTNKLLVIGHNDSQEVVEISATGAAGLCTINPSGTLTYAHAAHTDVMDLGCFYATGSADTVTAFLAVIDAQPAAGTTNNCYIGSEYISLKADQNNGYTKLNDTTVKFFCLDTGRQDSHGYSYPHAPEAPVLPNFALAHPVSDPNSLVAQYGIREAYVNPVGIIDPDTMDKLCYNILTSGTANATWGRCMMPASMLPATVDLGDWVYIAEADLSATSVYQIVGLEYDQKKGVWWIELGSTEDYYVSSISGNRGTFDLSLSSI